MDQDGGQAGMSKQVSTGEYRKCECGCGHMAATWFPKGNIIPDTVLCPPCSSDDHGTIGKVYGEDDNP